MQNDKMLRKGLYSFNVTQPAKTYYRGKIDIEAENEEDAIATISKMSQQEIESATYNWNLADECDGDGIIEVWDDKGRTINNY